MVTVDSKRDYYADLGLPVHANPDEIKKKYKNLALRYHPDHNPGEQLESTAIFQVIKDAYEVLNDPQKRLKYDSDRGFRRDSNSKFCGSEHSQRYSFGSQGSNSTPAFKRARSFHAGVFNKNYFPSRKDTQREQPASEKRDTSRAQNDNATTAKSGERKGTGRQQFSDHSGANDETSCAGSKSRRPKGFAPYAASSDECMAASTSYRHSVFMEGKAANVGQTYSTNWTANNSKPAPASTEREKVNKMFTKENQHNSGSCTDYMKAGVTTGGTDGSQDEIKSTRKPESNSTQIKYSTSKPDTATDARSNNDSWTDMQRIIAPGSGNTSAAPQAPQCILSDLERGEVGIKATWDTYITASAAYMDRWYSFQANMLGHFLVGVSQSFDTSSSPGNQQDAWKSAHQGHSEYVKQHREAIERLTKETTKI